MAEEKDNLDIRLDALLGQIKQRQDRALSRIDPAAQRRQIMRQLGAAPVLQMRPRVIRFAFGSMAAAAAAVLLVVAGLRFLRPATPPQSLAKVELVNTQSTGGEITVSLAAREPQAVAQSGSAAVEYRRIRHFEQGLAGEENNEVAHVPAGAVLMIGTVQPARGDLPYLE